MVQFAHCPKAPAWGQMQAHAQPTLSPQHAPRFTLEWVASAQRTGHFLYFKTGAFFQAALVCAKYLLLVIFQKPQDYCLRLFTQENFRKENYLLIYRAFFKIC